MKKKFLWMLAGSFITIFIILSFNFLTSYEKNVDRMLRIAVSYKGDTLYNRNIFKVLPEDIYAVFLPINGVGNNMNMADAARFARDCGAKLAVPIHFGMFDNINPEDFIFENRVIPEVYKKIPI